MKDGGIQRAKTAFVEWIGLCCPKRFPDLDGQMPAEMGGSSAKASVVIRCDS